MGLKCRLDIKAGLVEKAVDMYETGNIKIIGKNTLFVPNRVFKRPGQDYQIAESIVKRAHRDFGGPMAYRVQYTDGQQVIFDPSDQVVDEYYDTYLKQVSYEGALATQQEDAARAGIEFKEDYLFDGETRQVNPYETPNDPFFKQGDFKILNSASDLNITEEEADSIYENYVNLMDRKREGKAIDRKKFDLVWRSLPVFKSKDTYMFGEWDSENNLFKVRLMSSPNIRELYQEMDNLIDNVSVMASVPGDIGKMLAKKGMYKLDVDKPYNFRGEDMVKNLYFSSQALAEKVFNKPVSEVSFDDVVKYDEFFSYWRLIDQLKDAYEDKDYNRMFTLLKEIGVYDFTAYKLIGKAARGITAEDSANIMNMIKSNSQNNKVTIDRTDLINSPKIYNTLNNDLNKLLARYLSKFGFKTEIVDNLQEELNIDSLAHLDLLNKILYVNKENQQDYPQQAGRAIAFMMQHNPLVTEIIRAMRKLPQYKNMETKTELINAVGDLITNELHKKTNTKIPSSLAEMIRELINMFFRMLNSIRFDRINRNVGVIADAILVENQSLITKSMFKPGKIGKTITQVTMEKALEKDSFARSIVDRMAPHFILTGSITLSEQGLVLRPDENLAHDLDWKSFVPRKESVKIFEQLYPDNKYIREIYDEDKGIFTDTWLIPPAGHSIKNLELRGEDRIKLISYEVVDNSTGEVVSTYDGKTDTHSNPVIEGKFIDIFSYEKMDKAPSTIEKTLESGTKVFMADWRDTFSAKLAWSRLKDIWDYNRFIPFNRLEDKLNQDMFDDLDNLNFTDEVIYYLYESSSKRMDIEEFGKQLQILAVTLQGIGYNNQDIIEKLKCL